jgi:hypothetical protein
MTNGYQALLDLKKGANLTSAACTAILSSLYDRNGVTAIPNAVDQIVQLASTILTEGWLFDGLSSNTPYTVANFGELGNTKPPTDGTIGGLFAANPDLLGLSQNTGLAIWMRSTSGADAAEAQDIVLHEILHKIAQKPGVERIPDGALSKACFKH